jgi:hypothetical protein
LEGLIMPRGWLIGCLLLMAGCLGGPEPQSSTWMERFRQFSGPAGSDVVTVDVALVQEPLGSAFLDRAVWAAADEMIVPAASKGPLDDAGWRVGLIGGHVPAELLSLLKAERSCVAMNRHSRRSGDSIRILLGPVHAQLRLSGNRTYTQAQCSLQLTPTLQPDGKIRIVGQPQVAHGPTRLAPKQSGNGTDWTLNAEQAVETWPKLAFAVAVAPAEYVVLGTRATQTGTIGQACWVADDPPMQRLVVIRAGATNRPPPLGTTAPLAALARKGE